MKRSELFFSAMQVPVDFLMIVLAAISAFAIRNVPEIMINLGRPKLYTFSFESWANKLTMYLSRYCMYNR